MASRRSSDTFHTTRGHQQSVPLASRLSFARALSLSLSRRCQKAAGTEEHHKTLLEDEKLKKILDFGGDRVDNEQILDRVRLAFDAGNGPGVLVYEV